MKKGLKQHRENYHKSIGQSELPTFFPSGTKYPDGVSDDEKPNKKPKKNKNKGKKQSTLEKTFGTGTGKDEDGDPAKEGDPKKKGDPNPDPDTSEPTTDAITRKRKHSTLENSLAGDHAKKSDPSSSTDNTLDNEGQQGETAENKPAKSSCVS